MRTATSFSFQLTAIAMTSWLSLCLLTGLPAQADVVLQNDSLATPAAGTVLNTFIPGEEAAAWFTAPSAGHIVGVQVLWRSMFGGQPTQPETAIHVYGGGPFPNPGPVLASVIAPQFADGAINQFNHRDPPTNAIPMNIPVTAGQNFVVSIEFLNQSSGNVFAPSVVYDTDGCQPGKNSVFAIPGGWVDACAAGVTGDLGIRAIHRPIPEPVMPGIGALLVLAATRRRFRARA